MSSDRAGSYIHLFQQQSKELTKEHYSENSALFDAAADVERIRGAAKQLHYSVHISVGGLSHSLQFMLATGLWENIKQTVSADQ